MFVINRVLIAPSILSADPMNFGGEVKSVELGGADWHHIDVMDGHFVPNLTFGLPLIRALKKVAKLPLDVHIMVSNPDAVVEHYLSAGADILVFHLEASTHPHRIVQQIHAEGKKAGIALNPGTSIGTSLSMLSSVDVVMLM
ncbi:MAG: ribulose-phosphate 3-epimerase, partial [Proteobacteria bacterium]|nr:ribulose-phosphate 3-epimerase [Pseudomonadota bacterium]